MSEPAVSIHPYFKVHPGQIERARALLPKFVERTSSEKGCRSYEFTIAGDVVFCRESYAGAASALAHLENVDALLKEMLTLSDLERLEIHGPAAEIEKLQAPLGALKPTWFVLECGLER